MVKVHTFQMEDRLTPRWTRSQILREALNAAKRVGEMMLFEARAVALREKSYRNDPISPLGFAGVADLWDADATVYTIDVYGHFLEVPECMKTREDRLYDNVQSLCSGAWEDQ
jgi:hypothetical protein